MYITYLCFYNISNVNYLNYDNIVKNFYVKKRIVKR